jgi:DNA primase
MLDADPAGRAATLRAIHLFVEAGLPCKIAALRPEAAPASPGSEGHALKKVDPDELARRDLPKLQALLDEAPDAVEHFMNEVAGAAEPSVPGRVRAIGECAPLLRAVSDRLTRDLYVDRLSQLLKVPTAKILQALRETQARPVPRPLREPDGSVPTPGVEPGAHVEAAVVSRDLSLPVRKLFGLLAQHPALLPKLTPAMIASVDDPAARALLESAIAQRVLDGRAVEEAALEIRAAVADTLLGDEFADLLTPDTALAQIVAQLQTPRDRAALSEERKAALERGDMDRVRALNAKILASTRP